MFEGASSFNQDLSNWDVSSGLYFVSACNLVMVYYALASCFVVTANNLIPFPSHACLTCTQDQMFAAVSPFFNQDLSSWDVSAGLSFVSEHGIMATSL